MFLKELTHHTNSIIFQNNWVQRAIKSQGPKTIDQIHQDAKDEKEQMALKAAASVAVGKSQVSSFIYF